MEMTPPTNNSSAGLSKNLHHQQQPILVPTPVSGHNMKHTGRVHVRGLFRRVWRPRFLELNTDSGVLRYFEASTSSSPRKEIYNNEGGGDGALSREMQAFSLPPSFLCSANDDGMISNSNNNNNNKHNLNKMDNLPNEKPTHQSINSKAHKYTDTYTHTIEELTNIDDDSIGKPFPSTSSKELLDISFHSENNDSKVKIITPKKYQNDTQHENSNNSSQNSSINDNDYLNILNTSHDSTNVARNESWHHIMSDTNHSSKMKQESEKEEFIMNDYLQPPQISSHTSSLSSHNQIHNTTTSTTIQAEFPHRYHQHRPKAVLIILSARMIDIRQLRDIHIGLPKGKFGFIFRGRPCDMSIIMTNNNNNHNNNHHHYNSYDDLCNPLSILSATEHEFFSSSRDYFCFVDTYDEAQSWVTVLQSAASVTLSKIRFQQRKNYGFLFDEEEDADEYNQQHGRGYYYNDYRDDDTHDVDDGYYTDEETSSYYQNLLMSPSSNNNHHVNKNTKRKIHSHKKQSWLSSAAAARRKQSLFEDMSSCESSSSVYLGDSNYDHHSHNDSILDDNITSNQCNDDTTTTNEPFIIITKVKSFELNNMKRKRLVRLQVDILYKVQILLLNKNHFNARKEKHFKLSPSSRKNERHDICYNNDKIEERTLLRSWDQFTYLIDCMIDELQNQVPSKVVIMDGREQLSSDSPKKAKDGMTVLQDVKSKLSNIKIENDNKWIMTPYYTYDTYCKNVTTIDEVLRTVSSHGQLCNLSILKEFLSLQNMQSNTQTNCNQQNNSLVHQKSNEDHQIKCSKFLNIKVGESTDDFVRDWLFGEVSNCNNTTNLNTRSIEWVKICLLLSLRQNPWIELPLSLGIIYLVMEGVHVSMLSSYSQFYSCSIPIRLDVLCIMTITMFYIGFQLGLHSNDRNGNQVSKASKPHNKEEDESTKRLLKATTKRKRIKRNNSNQNNDNDRYHGLEDDLILSNNTSYDSDYDIHIKKSPTMDNSIDDDDDGSTIDGTIPSQLPKYPCNNGTSCWSTPDDSIFKVRGKTYLSDRIKIPSNTSPFTCRGVEVWLTENAERHIARYPYVLNGRLGEEDTFVVNFLLPFANFVAYFTIPPEMMSQSRMNTANNAANNAANNSNNNSDNGGGGSFSKCPTEDNTLTTPLNRVWNKFINGDQAYRDARLKLLPIVMDGPWIVKKAVGPGTSPALLGQAIPLQYYFTHPSTSSSSSSSSNSNSTNTSPSKQERKGVYEVDIIITASKIAKGILNVVKGHTKKLTIAFAFIIEGSDELELPETVLCSFQVHSLHLENCPHLPEYTLTDDNDDNHA